MPSIYLFNVNRLLLEYYIAFFFVLYFFHENSIKNFYENFGLKKQNKNKTALTEALDAIPQNMKHIIEQTTDTGASAWLNDLQLKNQNLYLNKEEFRDALRLRYDGTIKKSTI